MGASYTYRNILHFFSPGDGLRLKQQEEEEF